MPGIAQDPDPSPTAGRPTELVVPYLNPNLRLVGLQAVLILIAIVATVVLTGPGDKPPVGEAGTIYAVMVCGILGIIAFLNRRRAPFRLRREGSTLEGLPSGPLPLDHGRILVRQCPPIVSGGSSGGIDARPRFDITYDTERDTVPIFLRTGSPWRLSGPASHVAHVRTVVEGICRVGGYQMAWTDETGEEVREVAELDTPLVARLATQRAREPAVVETGSAPRSHQRDDGTLVLPTVQVYHRPVVAMLVLGIPGLLLLALFHGTGAVAAGGSLIGPQLAWILVAGAGAAAFTPVFLGRTTEVDPSGIRLRVRLLGVTLRDRHVPAERLESLYVVPGPREHRLAIAGDGLYETAVVVGTVEKAAGARRYIEDALLGP